MSEVRSGAVLMADIAAATEFRARVGDRAADAELDPLIQAFTVIVAKVSAVGPNHYGMDLALPENAFRFKRWIQTHRP